MIRLFETHFLREQKELGGMWKVTAEEKPGKIYQMPVPGCVEQHPDFLDFRGHFIYTKDVTLTKESNVRLEFKGVSHTADVFWDGVQIAHHYNAFTPFATVIPHVAAGKHEIKVLVDNTFSEASALHVPNDYYTYGGITRAVAMEEVSDVFLERIHVTPILQGGSWQAKVEVWAKNLADSTRQSALQLFLGAQSGVAGSSLEGQKSLLPSEEKFSIAAGEEKRLEFLVDCAEVLPWNPGEGKLYFMTAQLFESGVAQDDLVERFGFREVKVVHNRICVNGKPIFPKGFNRHEDYANVGCAVPLQLMVQDLDLMQAAGANAVRTCHYPNDELFLDLCDERGFLVWEENHARGFTLDRMTNPNFERQCEDCIREMIENHYNHPSIFIWGILNECASETEEGRRMYAKQYAQIRALDGTRPTTSATCRHFQDICLDLPDVVSFNMYSGWYEDVDPKEKNERELQWISEAGGADKPIIVSEVGAAALYGYRDRAHCKWSEERQSDILRENLEVYMSNPAISGLFIWQFADCRVTEEEWFSTRARCHNNKGVVDEYRRPKEGYDTAKEMFEKYWN